MKRIIVCLLCVILLLGFTGCGIQMQHLVLTTGGATGAYYIFGGEIATMIAGKIDGLEITTETSGGSKDNILALTNGEAEVGITQNDVMSYAFEGTSDFGGKPVDGFSAIGSLFPELVQIVVAKDSGINSVSDLRGRNIGIGAIGSGSYFNVVQILEMFGMTLQDVNPQYLSYAECAESFQNRQIDAFVVTGPYAHVSITDAAMKRNINILGFSEDEIAKLQNHYGFYVKEILPAGTYEGVDQDVVCPAVTAVLVVSNKLSDELVYQITKNLFEGKEELTNAKKEYLNPKSAVLGIPTTKADMEKGVTNGSIHPGALKYYREIGVIQ